MQANLVGVALATAPGKACYVPLHHKAGDGFDFGGAAGRSRRCRCATRSSC